VTVKDVLKCLATKAVRPSALTPALNMHEMEKLITMLSNESLTAIAKGLYQCPNTSIESLGIRYIRTREET